VRRVDPIACRKGAARETTEEYPVAVRIRLKKLGRKHRPFYRVCAMDSRVPRDGRVLEELGTYDPMVPYTDARAVLNAERIQYWLSVGAKPTENMHILIKKYGPNGTHLAKQRAALDQLAQDRRRREPSLEMIQAAQAAAAAAPAYEPASHEPAVEAPAAEPSAPAAEAPQA
jgi:small subunit ribosomal protein S16